MVVFQLNNIELHQADCFDVMNDLIKQNVKVDAIICDPPYLINQANWDKEFNMPLAINLCYDLLKDNGNLILFQ